MKTVGDLKSSVAGILSGLNLNNVTNLNGAIERAARTLVQKADIIEATGRQNFTLYDGVYDYLAPSTIFGGALLDFRPKGDDRQFNDYVYRKPIELFDRTKHFLPNGASITLEYDKGVGRLRLVSARTKLKAVLDGCSTTKWTGSGSASTPVLDYTTFYNSPAALRFNLSASASGNISRTLESQVDLSTDNYEGVGVVFIAVWLPSATAFTSIGIKLGNDATNYVDISDTDAFLGSFVANDWNIIALNLASATETGTVDWSKIDYAQIYFNTDAMAQSNVRLGALWVSLPVQYELIFQSAAIFMTTGSNPSLTISDDNDSILLNDAAYTLFEFESALAILFQMGGTLSSPMVQNIKATLHGSGADIGLYAHYRGDNPSEKLRVIGSYYD